MANNHTATSDTAAEPSNPFESEQAHEWVGEATDEPLNAQASSESSADGYEDTLGGDEQQPLGYTRCPECNARQFVARQLVYETRTFDEHGALASIGANLRGELEFVCADCGTCLREMPAARRTFYDEVGVLQRDLQTAVRRQLRCWFVSVCRWLPGGQL
ncbi:hypothetical protein ACFPYI_21590 [Halomarina salina]|uniref:Uncharacterized protein n=1 Tax=Halomarina salina TaxID=1872699 RepID=A0ABD5RTM4_9EURY|nr:hypothetical protein [Halomarina salina]